MKEPSGIVGGLRRGIERTMIGEHINAKTKNFSILGCSDFALHVIVTSKARRHQILGTVLNPLHWFTGHDGTNDRANVARIDWNLVAEAAANIGGDDLNFVFRQTSDECIDRAVCVGCLSV